MMDGQGILGIECAWCDKPATTEVQVRLVLVGVCDDHRGIMEAQPERQVTHRPKQKQSESLFDGQAAPGDALTGG